MAIQVNLRVSEELRSKLTAAAERRGVSMNKEINDRLSRAFEDDAISGEGREDAILHGILSVIAAAMNSAGQAAGFLSTFTLDGARKWLNDPFAFDQARKAAEHVLRECRPPGDITKPDKA